MLYKVSTKNIKQLIESVLYTGQEMRERNGEGRERNVERKKKRNGRKKNGEGKKMREMLGRREKEREREGEECCGRKSEKNWVGKES